MRSPSGRCSSLQLLAEAPCARCGKGGRQDNQSLKTEWACEGTSKLGRAVYFSSMGRQCTRVADARSGTWSTGVNNVTNRRKACGGRHERSRDGGADPRRLTKAHRSDDHNTQPMKKRTTDICVSLKHKSHRHSHREKLAVARRPNEHGSDPRRGPG